MLEDVSLKQPKIVLGSVQVIAQSCSVREPLHYALNV